MYGDQHIFELPIYLEPEKNYYERFEELVEARTVESWRRTGDPRKDLDWHRQRTDRWREMYLRGYGGRWAYNQIFGFLGIYPLGDQLRGATWYSSKKLARRNITRKEIDLYGKAFEMTVREDQTSEEIFSNLMAEIQALRTERPYKRRFLCTRSLELAGPFFNWRKLMDISTQCGLFGVRVENLPDLLIGRFDRLGARRDNES